ncbi:MAG: hypothetical protein R2854_09160 [Caldilineaceae bacterium]
MKPLDGARAHEGQVRPWLLPVYARLRSGQGEFLAELRPIGGALCALPGHRLRP